MYPRTHSDLGVEDAGELTKIYTWKGTDPARPAVVLLGHLDVPSVRRGAHIDWEHAPFSGKVSDGFVWGRGAMDDKSMLVAQFEAIEALLASGFKPSVTLVLVVTHDHYQRGLGAQAAVMALKRRGMQVETVLDQGMTVIADLVPQLSRPVAMVGVAEKGMVRLKVKSKKSGQLKALEQAFESDPMPAQFEGPITLQFDYLGPELPFVGKMIAANRWLLSPLILRNLTGNPGGNDQVRTTLAKKQRDGDEGVWTFRVRPGDTVDETVKHVRAVLGDRADVTTVSGSFEPTATSEVETSGFQAIQRAISAVFPDALVAPALHVDVTDARHFEPLTRNLYRFTPIRVSREELPRLNGVDERLSKDAVPDAVTFYAELIRNTTK